MQKNAPETIWLQTVGCDASEDDGYEPDDSNVTWCREQVFDTDVEYVRSDVSASRIVAQAEKTSEPRIPD